jgi:hypothetical protein
MSTFDFALGIQLSTINTGISELYANDVARRTLFMKSMKIGEPAFSLEAAYDIRSVPVFSFSPAATAADRWAKSIDTTGFNPETPMPTRDLFVLTIPSFYAEMVRKSGARASGTATDVTVFCTFGFKGNSLSFKALSVWVDQTAFSSFDEDLMSGEILPELLERLDTMLEGMSISLLSFKPQGVKIDLMPPVAILSATQLVVASSLTSTKVLDVSGFTWPSEPFFVLVSGRAVKQVAEDAAKKMLVGKSFEGKGSVAAGTATYSGKVSVNQFSLNMDGTDMTRATVTMAVGLDGEMNTLDLGGPCSSGAATANL